MVRVQTISPRPQFNNFSRDTVPLKDDAPHFWPSELCQLPQKIVVVFLCALPHKIGASAQEFASFNSYFCQAKPGFSLPLVFANFFTNIFANRFPNIFANKFADVLG